MRTVRRGSKEHARKHGEGALGRMGRGQKSRANARKEGGGRRAREARDHARMPCGGEEGGGKRGGSCAHASREGVGEHAPWIA